MTMRIGALGLAALCALGDASLAARRDPTQPPAGYGVAQTPAARETVDGFRPTHLVVVEGQRYLVWRGKRYGVGDTVEGARIERLAENEVWLRSGEALRKLPLYPGIEKKERP